jgi:hypothetical protein
MTPRICAEAQGDGVPCTSVRVACEECVRARPLRKRLRRRAKGRESGGVGETPRRPSDTATDPKAR